MSDTPVEVLVPELERRIAEAERYVKAIRNQAGNHNQRLKKLESEAARDYGALSDLVKRVSRLEESFTLSPKRNEVPL